MFETVRHDYQIIDALIRFNQYVDSDFLIANPKWSKEGKRPADHIGPMRHSGRQRLGSRLVRLAGSVVGRRRSTSRR